MVGYFVVLINMCGIDKGILFKLVGKSSSSTSSFCHLSLIAAGIISIWFQRACGPLVSFNLYITYCIYIFS